MVLYDTHSHLNDPDYDDLEEVLARAKASDVNYINVIGYDLASSERALDIALQHPGVYAVIGLHPHSAEEWGEEARRGLESLLQRGREKIVAIGEIGLDYHFENRASDALQEQAFVEQMALAKDFNLPIVIHTRDAMEDTLVILKRQKIERGFSERAGVVHCFSGEMEAAETLMQMDFYLGFDGPVTFKNGKADLAVAKTVPIDKLLLETDCPYLAPVPKRGKRNEPAYLSYIAEVIAAEKQMTIAELARSSTTNALNLFNISI